MTITPEQQALIIEALEAGGTPQQAARHSGADYSALLAFIEEKGGESWILELRGMPIFRAKQVVAMEASRDAKAAQWLLTHHKESKKEWGDRTEHTGADGESLFPKPLLGGLSGDNGDQEAPGAKKKD